MKFTLSWLKDYLDISADINEICAALTKIGLEVEELEDKAKKYADFSVAQIISATGLENSNKLKICQVQTSLQKEPLQIICGAKNARAGIKVAFAKIGSVIPSNGMIIKKAKIAGVESSGMLCSAAELNLGEDGDGIIEIDDKWQIGSEISKIYGLNDAIIEINVTPNRGDCLGVYGIARDLAAAGIATLKYPDIANIKQDHDFSVEIKNPEPDLCSAISFCAIRDIKNCQSPAWLKNRLEAVGINSISAVVDITNYVMMCLNQPMHAYDASKIEGNLQVKLAQNGEKFNSLKQQEIELDDKSLMIADDSKNIALAGIIGGQNSSCDIETNHIILEAACFNSSSIARSGRKFGILSDSRYRFERGVDVDTQQLAIKMAIDLIVKICGGKVSNIITNSHNYEKKIINFEIANFSKIIGIEISLENAINILQNLGFAIINQDALSIEIQVPSWRYDITCYQDIVEEIIRIYGYDKIENQPFIASTTPKTNIDITKQAKINLVSKGFVETISWTFIDSKLARNFAEINNDFFIANPISQEMDYLRPNLLLGLLKSYKNNNLRNISNLSLFEAGNVFIDSAIDQKNMISGIRVGKNKPDSHYKDNRDFDVFDAKKDIFDLISLWGLKTDNLQLDSSNPLKYYHPYRFSAIKLGKNIIGYFGEIHPLILQKFSIKTKVSAFEIFIDNLPIPKNKLSKPYIVSDFQAVERDFAFIIEEEAKIGNLINDIYKADKEIIKDVILFDIYRGQNIEQNKKSVALRVKIQSLEKTLKGDEIDNIFNKITNILEQKHQAKLRTQ